MIKNKVDLHVHIDGSVEPSSVYEISRIEHIEPYCQQTLKEITASMIMMPGDNDPTFSCFDTPIDCMQSSYALSRITRELVSKLDDQGLIYAELRFAPQFHLRKGLNQRDVITAVIKGMNEALATARQIKTQIILCAMDFGSAVEYREANLETVKMCKEFLGKGVCGLDLAGFETDLNDYRELFQLAQQYNIPTTCHCNLEIETALSFHPDRIGHGYKTISKQTLIQSALSQKITYEMCPQSSYSYCGFEINPDHPLHQLFLQGVKMTINTDNLTVLNTDLEHEYDLCYKMGFSEKDIIKMNNDAIRGAFLTEEEKNILLSIQP